MTGKRYSHGIKGRQENLDLEVKKSWASLGLAHHELFVRSDLLAEEHFRFSRTPLRYFPIHFPYLLSVPLALPERQLSTWRCVCNQGRAPIAVLTAKGDRP